MLKACNAWRATLSLTPDRHPPPAILPFHTAGIRSTRHQGQQLRTSSAIQHSHSSHSRHNKYSLPPGTAWPSHETYSQDRQNSKAHNPRAPLHENVDETQSAPHAEQPNAQSPDIATLHDRSQS